MHNIQQITLLIFCFLFSLTVQAQLLTDYKARAEHNIQFLIKDKKLYEQVKIKDNGIYLYPVGGGSKPEFVLYYDEADYFLKLTEAYDEFEMLEFYNRKGSQHIDKSDITRSLPYTISLPTSMEGLKVAIDPGHFASNWKEATFEKKYLKVRGAEILQDDDLYIFEADFNDATSLILADTLVKLGATPFIDRERGLSAVGKPFEAWYSQNYEIDIQNLVATGEFPREKAAGIVERNNKYEIFQKVYKYMDFVGRTRLINDHFSKKDEGSFNPDLTLVIHYNAEEANPRDNQKYTRLVEQNWAMAFVPGSFMFGELRKQNQRIDFLRWLVSPDLEQSMLLANYLMQDHKDYLKVLPHDQEEDYLAHVENACIQTDYPGVYPRNLAMTRKIESPVVYGESLYQDNEQELARLVKKDYFIETTVTGKLVKMRTSKRCYEVAMSYLHAIQEWIKVNKSKEGE